MRLRLPIGLDDFRQLRELGLEYVDKSHLIRDLIEDAGVQVVLLPRPRRFGKTLNISMLRCFFERRGEDLSHLFQDLRIWQAGPAYREHFQRYPVLHLTFKGTRHESFEGCWEAIQKKIEILFREHQALLASGQLDEWEVRDFRAILDRTADQALYARSLLDLSTYLHRVHGERVVILIDEYDEPIHAGHLSGYAPQILAFCRALLTEGLKGNPHLHKAVLTGILRVARESIFSGLNNVAVYSLLQPEHSAAFGFTEPEVRALLDRAGRPDLLEVVRDWYDGYLFGSEVIYNPWSVLNFLHSEDKEPRPHWLSTSANDLIRDLLQHHATRLQPNFEALLRGDGVERVLDESVSLGELRDREDALFSLLVFSGYLKAEKRPRGPGERAAHLLSIPNREVREVYATTFRAWMADRMKGHGGHLERLTSALLGGDAEALEDQLQAFALNLLSYHDVGSLAPEQVYQGFVVGLLAVLEPSWEVRSNRESGRGRPDVLVRPRRSGQPGAVLELKVARPPRRTLDQALAEGLEQIRQGDYAADLRAAGAAPVHAFAVAFDGKTVRVSAAALGEDG